MGVGRILLGILIILGVVTGIAWVGLNSLDDTQDGEGPSTGSPTPTPATDPTPTPAVTTTPSEPTRTPSSTAVTATATGTPGSPITSVTLAHAVQEEVNGVREDRSIPVLNREPLLDEMARNHASTMATHGYVGHTEPDGTTLSDRYDEAGLGCQLTSGERGGENLLRLRPNTTDEGAIAKQVVQTWLNDSEAGGKLTSRIYSEQGIGVAITDNGTVYVVQNFC